MHFVTTSYEIMYMKNNEFLKINEHEYFKMFTNRDVLFLYSGGASPSPTK